MAWLKRTNRPKCLPPNCSLQPDSPAFDDLEVDISANDNAAKNVITAPSTQAMITDQNENVPENPAASAPLAALLITERFFKKMPIPTILLTTTDNAAKKPNFLALPTSINVLTSLID